MKKLYFLGISLFLVAACSNKLDEQEFDTSAAERMTSEVKKYKEMLTSAPYGWSLELYAGGESASLGGYNNTVVFTETEVTAQKDTNPAGTEEATSKYKVFNNGGVVLSFDEYNSVLHYYSTPNGSQYEAMRADFEFLITGSDENTIYLKGKKYEVETRLVKLTEEASTYIDKVHKNYQQLERGLAELVVNEASVEVSKTDRTITYAPDSSKTDTKTIPYVYTDKGIRFYKPITIDGVQVQELSFDEKTDSFKSEDDKVNLYLPKKLLFDMEATEWLTNVATQTNEEFQKVFLQVRSENTQAQGGELLSIDMRWGKIKNLAQPYVGVRFFSLLSSTSTRGYVAVYRLKFSGTKNKNEVNIQPVGAGTNWDYYTYFYPMIDLIVKNAPYTYEVDDESAPTTVKLVSTKNPAITFEMNKN